MTPETPEDTPRPLYRYEGSAFVLEHGDIVVEWGEDAGRDLRAALSEAFSQHRGYHPHIRISIEVLDTTELDTTEKDVT